MGQSKVVTTSLCRCQSLGNCAGPIADGVALEQEPDAPLAAEQGERLPDHLVHAGDRPQRLEGGAVGRVLPGNGGDLGEGRRGRGAGRRCSWPTRVGDAVPYDDRALGFSLRPSAGRMTTAGGERLVEILDQVLGVLDAAAQPDQAVGEPHRLPHRRRHRGVGHAARDGRSGSRRRRATRPARRSGWPRRTAAPSPGRRGRARSSRRTRSSGGRRARAAGCDGRPG